MQSDAFFWVKVNMEKVYKKRRRTARVPGRRQWVGL